MSNFTVLQDLVNNGRLIFEDDVTPRGSSALGVLGQLPGVWKNTDGLEGRAWNLIALPFGTPGALGDFRLLLNQGNETLQFDLVDLGVPNRGANHQDQHLAALRYLQSIDQVAAVDATSDSTGKVVVPATPDTNDTPKGALLHVAPGVKPGMVGIHREPGLFLHLANLAGPATNAAQPGPDLARLANVPHGDAVLAMGFGGAAPEVAGAPDFTNKDVLAAFDPLPIGLASSSLDNVYFGPYKHFHDAPFQGVFDPTQPLGLLRGAIEQAIPGSRILGTTTFSVDSQISGGIQNIPFVTQQANTTRVNATFWVQRVQTPAGERFVLQYAQRVLLEFFPRGDGKPGLIQWPHISINTLIRQ